MIRAGLVGTIRALAAAAVVVVVVAVRPVRPRIVDQIVGQVVQVAPAVVVTDAICNLSRQAMGFSVVAKPALYKFQDRNAKNYEKTKGD